MRIVIDMQGAQSGSRLRGIGRYVTALTTAMARHKGGHELILALNAAFPESIDSIRSEFAGLIAPSDIRVWKAPGPTNWGDPGNNARREAAERIREAFLTYLRPDAILVSSLFEGYGDTAVTSVGAFDHDTPTASILYDLFPLTHPDKDHDAPGFRAGYTQKLSYLKKSNLLLAISEYSRQVALDCLHLASDSVVNIFGACDPSFRRLDLDKAEVERFRKKFGLSKPFVMYAGGADRRKNLHRLIKSYALLPNRLSRTHQLVIVGDMPKGHMDDLRAVASSCGLSDTDMLITGYVDEEALLKFYNTCELFVFPSLLEGLGLPPLEAMACGAPVIAANVASLPEVIGREDAMFNPCLIKSISGKMAEALTDQEFRESLIESGNERVKMFSWDVSAKKAIAALERFAPVVTDIVSSGKVETVRAAVFQKRRLSILLLKLDHIGDFLLALPAISKLRARYPHADMDVVVGSWNVPLAESTGFFRTVFAFDYIKRSESEFPDNRSSYVQDFLSGLGNYDLAIDLRRQRDTRFILAKVDAACKVGYTSFDESVDSLLDISLPAYEDACFTATPMNKTNIAKQMLALVDALPSDENDYISLPYIGGGYDRVPGTVAVFPCAGNDAREWSRENFIELVEALSKEEAVEKINVFLADAQEHDTLAIRTGDKVALHVGLKLTEMINLLSKNSVCVANNSGGGHLSSYLGIPTVSIYSGQETVAEWMPPFGNTTILHRNAFCCPCHSPSLAACHHDAFCLRDIPVDVVRETVVATLDGTAGSVTKMGVGDEEIIDRLIASIAQIKGLGEEFLMPISTCIAETFDSSDNSARLFVDISELERNDKATGVQRVTKNILQNIFSLVPRGWKVIPVCHKPGERVFRIASKYCHRHYGGLLSELGDEAPISPRVGDIFLGLDLNLSDLDGYREIIKTMRKVGVRVEFLVHDLLCISMPRFFERELVAHFEKWLRLVCEGDGAICVSQATATELATWLEKNVPERRRDFKIRHSHNGADFPISGDADALPEKSKQILKTIGERPSFLMVSTLEPRKGHGQVLDAFNDLWRSGFDANLVFVGKQGWMVDDLVDSIISHPELNRRLFWLRGINDDFLDQVYKKCSCLIAASEGEGFGLFLVEAAQHTIPIIARDIPVFREIAGEHAYYFDDETPKGLAEAIRKWYDLWNNGRYPRSDDMPWVTWRQSASRLVELLYGENDEGKQIPEQKRRTR